MRSNDVVLLVPFQPGEFTLLDPSTRHGLGVHFASPIVQALQEATDYVGRPLGGFVPVFEDGNAVRWASHRSLSAVALATILERAKLRWQVLDPGIRHLGWWRTELTKLAPLSPPLVCICSTFINSGQWLRMLIAVIRRTLPSTKIAVGGYYYSTDTEDFLKLEADVLCIGEGELTLPRLVAAVRDGQPLYGIPGLYIRRPDGRLDFTGPPAQVDMATHCRPDWSLAPRIEPAVDPQNHYLDAHVETQRGCVFRCEFCTFRVLSAPNLMSPDESVERILDTRLIKDGVVTLIDATATFPHDRWLEILRRLIARGGSPHPIRAFARVSDIDDETAELMARANVRGLLIGQESGDQRILGLMRKGTKVSQIAPAMRALARHNISVDMSMIVGFPGENDESVANTRHLMCTINDESIDNPVVPQYRLTPFYFQDFATVTGKRQDHEAGAAEASRHFDVERSGRETIRTIIAISKVPHAPASGFPMNVHALTTLLLGGRSRREIHSAMKTLDRLLAIFLDHRTFGTPIDRAELKVVRDRLLAGQPRLSRLAAAKVHASSKVSGVLFGRARHEWQRHDATGPITRLIITAKAWQDTGSLRDSYASYRAGTYAIDMDAPASSAEIVQEVTQQASALISVASLKAKTTKLPRTA